jgi:hypothetical protein
MAGQGVVRVMGDGDGDEVVRVGMRVRYVVGSQVTGVGIPLYYL